MSDHVTDSVGQTRKFEEIHYAEFCLLQLLRNSSTTIR